MDPKATNQVKVGNKPKSRSMPSVTPLDKTQSTIVINLTPKISPDTDIGVHRHEDGVTYRHYRKNDDGTWSMSKVIHHPMKDDDKSFDPEHHLGFVSYEHPHTGQVHRYYVQHNHQDPIREHMNLSGIELDCVAHCTFMSAENPFYLDKGHTRLMEQLRDFDVDGVDGHHALDTIDTLKRTVLCDQDPFEQMVRVMEEFKFLSHGLLDIKIGIKNSGLLVSLLQ